MEDHSTAFNNPDHVAIVIHNYRWRLSLAKGEFSGKYSHRELSGIGHNVPQEAPQAFAEAIIEADGY